MANIEKMTIKIKRMNIEGRKKLGVHPVLAFRYLPVERRIKELKSEVDELAKLQKEALFAATKAIAATGKKRKKKKELEFSPNVETLISNARKTASILSLGVCSLEPDRNLLTRKEKTRRFQRKPFC